jgi:hypothetical protein
MGFGPTSSFIPPTRERTLSALGCRSRPADRASHSWPSRRALNGNGRVSESMVAMPRPMPDAAPVTIAVLPETRSLRTPSQCLSASADRVVKDAHVIAAGDLPGLLSGEAAA